jgi:hypothetical protein
MSQPVAYDSTMDDLYALAIWLGPCPRLPDSLKNADHTARFIDYIDSQIINPFRSLKTEEFILKVIELTREKIPDISDGKVRANITMRLWAGCMDSAKTIRNTYVDKSSPDGTLPYTPEKRKNAWYQKMKPKSEEDSIYKYGVELGTVFRKIRGQPSYLEGIPKDSIVRRYVKAGAEGNVISPEDIVTS